MRLIRTMVPWALAFLAGVGAAFATVPLTWTWCYGALDLFGYRLGWGYRVANVIYGVLWGLAGMGAFAVGRCIRRRFARKARAAE